MQRREALEVGDVSASARREQRADDVCVAVPRKCAFNFLPSSAVRSGVKPSSPAARAGGEGEGKGWVVGAVWTGLRAGAQPAAPPAALHVRRRPALPPVAWSYGQRPAATGEGGGARARSRSSRDPTGRDRPWPRPLPPSHPLLLSLPPKSSRIPPSSRVLRGGIRRFSGHAALPAAAAAAVAGCSAPARTHRAGLGTRTPPLYAKKVRPQSMFGGRLQ